MGGKKKSRKRKFFIIFLLIVLIGVALPAGGLFLMINNTFGSQLVDDNLVSDEILEDYKLTNKISILLIGADQRGNDKKFNTDTIILATIDPAGPRISLLSIPRDTLVSIPGHPEIKINSIVPLTDDIEALQNKVSELTGLPISGYILTNFDGFKNIIDTVGGITVDVEKDMYFETGDKVDGIINLKKGLQKLDGSKALQYARYRNDGLADISRTARQQVVLKAVADEMLKLSTIPKLPWLIPQMADAVDTNLSLSMFLQLGKAAMQFRDAEIVSQTLPGKFLDYNGISYWKVDPDKAKVVARDLLKGITTSKIIGETEVINLLDPDEEKDIPAVPDSPLDPNGPDSNDVPRDPGEEDIPGTSDDEQDFEEPGDPNDPSIPQVPGNDKDPNGKGSTSYEEFLMR